ncbi:VOC family protein [Nonomuraea sp. NPDC049419]
MGIGVSQVSLYVRDQQKAVDFWSRKVGFTVTRDMAYGENRWIEVQPPSGGTRLALLKADPQWPETPAGPGYVLFEADDIEAEYERLNAAGVPFTRPPKQEHWGWSATFVDDEGHEFHLGQR